MMPFLVSPVKGGSVSNQPTMYAAEPFGSCGLVISIVRADRLPRYDHIQIPVIRFNRGRSHAGMRTQLCRLGRCSKSSAICEVHRSCANAVAKAAVTRSGPRQSAVFVLPPRASGRFIMTVPVERFGLSLINPAYCAK